MSLLPDFLYKICFSSNGLLAAATDLYPAAAVATLAAACLAVEEEATQAGRHGQPAGWAYAVLGA